MVRGGYSADLAVAHLVVSCAMAVQGGYTFFNIVLLFLQYCTSIDTILQNTKC
jgi:hypothetical protein